MSKDNDAAWVTAGGLGHDFVKIKFRSKYSQGMHFRVFVYGRSMSSTLNGGELRLFWRLLGVWIVPHRTLVLKPFAWVTNISYRTHIVDSLKVFIVKIRLFAVLFKKRAMPECMNVYFFEYFFLEFSICLYKNIFAEFFSSILSLIM